MKRLVLFMSLILLSWLCSSVHSQSRTVITTGSVGRSVVTPGGSNTSSNGSDIWQQLEQERIAAEKAEQERVAAEQAEQERIAAEKAAEQERLAAEKKAEQERLAAERAEQKRIAAEKAAEKAAEQERLAAERKAEQAKLAAERAEQARIADSIAAAARSEALAIKTARHDSIVNDRKERFASYPWTNIVLFNGSYALYPEYAIGLTYARVKQWGFYINAMMSPSLVLNYDYDADDDGMINRQKPFYSEKRKSTRISATAGALVRMRLPLYFYGGLGYGYRGLFYETSSKEWVAWNTPNTVYHGMHWEAGLMGNIKGFGISAGISSITDFSNIYYEAKIGLGFCINSKSHEK